MGCRRDLSSPVGSAADECLDAGTDEYRERLLYFRPVYERR